MSNQLKKKKILVIDDEVDLREMVKYQLQVKGFEVTTAEDGIDGLEKLKTFEPDLITLDMNMPRMNGLEFYEKIKGGSDKSQYPVLVLTARANMESLFRELDVDGFITKPFEIEQLIQECESIIKKNSRVVSVDGQQQGRARKVCIVENDSDRLKEISYSFLESGYVVNTAQSGACAMKRMAMDVPDVVLIKLKLEDISGDVVALKLKKMEEMENVHFVLYTSDSAIDMHIVEHIGKKIGENRLIESDSPAELLQAADSVFV
ncbi:hypothetical protein MNBD_UNCLBAC01-1225 [hydrothermal vent metagenome]|uniref:Response regulatory domain-containing protein n=1 Tax=hydrothermal vent metagenome TaxID=652676 RepID=A0A3B1DFZ0_9ZZZZ